MKSLKKTLALVLSLVMLVSTMSLTAFATEGSPASVGATETDATKVTVTVPSVNYTGKAQTATGIVVKYGDVTLVEGTDYVITTNNGGTNTGDYKVVIEGKGKYKFAKEATFTILGAAKPTKTTTVTATTQKTVSAATYKKKAKNITLKFKPSKNNKSTKVTYKVTGGKKATRKAIKVTYKKKKGKLVVRMPKGTKPGTYKIKVTLPSYNKSKKVTKTITVKVKK